MAKSNYLFGILSFAAVFVSGYAGSDCVVITRWLSTRWPSGYLLPVVWEGESLKLKAKSTRGVVSCRRRVAGCLLPVVCENQVHSKFCGIQRVGNKEWERKVLPEFEQNEDFQPLIDNSQFSNQKHEISPGAKSPFQTTDNRQPATGNRQQIAGNSLRQQAIKKIYDSQVGVREQGINTGPQVEEYLRYVNLGRGQPWCAAFICWVYGQGGIEHPRSGWTPDLFPLSKIIWSKACAYPTRQITGKRQPDGHRVDSYRVTTPGTGDIFGLFFPEKNRIAHAGFIDQWGDTWLITVEGNTNIAGHREGDGVYRKRRLVKSVYKVARYIE